MNPGQMAEAVLGGELRAAARVMRGLDDGDPTAVDTLKLLHPHTGRARVVGITGSPGVGKSSLTSALVGEFRAQGLRVGVVAVDPTSPFTGGAILGDRVRMQKHATDPGVFIRSLATRGHFGGITASTQAVARVMDAMGLEVILVETVGVGQDEVEIVKLADTTVVVTVPGLGDDIQAIKAGILEVGDIFVVNKMDREGAARTIGELEVMLSLDSGRERRGGWMPKVLPTCALDGRGIPLFRQTLDAHWRHLAADGGATLTRRRRERARRELLDLVQTALVQRFLADQDQGRALEPVVNRILTGETDPHTASEEVLTRWLEAL
ncbi:MAG: methylmalonyl Co-A mutase-associated GTPase MeaB [Deltaproteobacteria bacterium]|nr:methylmalonyl Co-A mutase-associated GTPase MeaB [Deltaproteobacteria bacterium]